VRSRGFTLVEVMVVVAVSLLLIAGLVGVYLYTARFLAFSEAKTSILQSLPPIYSRLRPMFAGASYIYDPDNVALGPIYLSPLSATYTQIEFYTTTFDYVGYPTGAWVLMRQETATDRYFIDPENGSCKPLPRVMVYVYYGGSPDTVPDTAQWQNWVADGYTENIPVLPLVGGQNRYSTLLVSYMPYQVNVGSGIDSWYVVNAYVTVGVARRVYSDSTCSTVVGQYPTDLFPYTAVFTINAKGIGK